MTFPPVQEEQLAFGGRSYSATGRMTTPDGSPHVKSMEFRLPRLGGCPSVSCQIVPHQGAKPLAAYSLKINDNVSGQTQIAIEAQTLDGGAAHGDHDCNIVAVFAPVRQSRAGGGRIEKNATQTRVAIDPPINGDYAVVVTEVRNEDNAGPSLFHLHVRTTAPDHFMLGHDNFSKPDPDNAPSYFWTATPY
ncbi:MAG: hypothetical protein KGM42_18905 [Hyphomicrobiales bacterium]|nr:hypothetical protein [Hyphomicrobiales bacterium]